MKRILCILTILILCCTAVSADGFFKDVPESHWAYENIMFFYEKGIVNGTSADTFSPDTFVTREQFAKMISIIYDRDNYIPKSQAFTDVTPDMWSYAYIDSVKEYMPGYGNMYGTYEYRPYNVAAREDVAYAIVKICGIYNEYTPDTEVLSVFADGDTVTYNRADYVSAAVQCGLMQGYDGYLRPKDGITRAEAVALLYRAIGRTDEEEYVPETEEVTPSQPEKEAVIPAFEGEYTYSVTGFNGFDAQGVFRINYGEDTKVLYSEINFGEGIYNVEITDVLSISDGSMEVLLLISLDGSAEAEGVKATFSDYEGEKPCIASDDGRWTIELQKIQ